MTTDASSREIEYLTSQIIGSKQPVTYHTLSRELSINNDYSKKILYDFYKSNKDKLTASFITSGTSKTAGTLIKLSFNELQLAEDVKLFEKINNIHIYCVNLRQVSVTNFEIASLELKYSIDHNNLDIFFQNGVIKGPALTIVKPITTSNTSTATKKESSLPATAKAISKSTTPIATSTTASETPKQKSAGLSSGYVSRKASATAAAPSNRSSSNRPTSDLLSRYVSRKAEASTAKDSKTSSKRSNTEPVPSFQYKSRKLEKQHPKEKFTASSIDNDDVEMIDDDNNEVSKPSKVSNTELENLFLDDSDFSDDENTDLKNTKEEPIITNQVEDIEEVEKPKQIEATESNDKEITNEPESNSQSKNPTPEIEEPKESTIDEDGYITSYRKKPSKSTNPSSNVSNSTKKTIPTPSNKKVKGDNKNKKQTSLMSFFGQKK